MGLDLGLLLAAAVAAVERPAVVSTAVAVIAAEATSAVPAAAVDAAADTSALPASIVIVASQPHYNSIIPIGSSDKTLNTAIHS